MSNLDDPSQGGRAVTAVSSLEGGMRSNHGSSLPRFREDNNNNTQEHISEGGDGLNSGRSLSTNFNRLHQKLVYPQLASEGAVMLESLRKKKETETQLRMLENRIRRLKDEETQAKIKQQMQKR
jgi:hypothetical protein